ncbi:hypothetical protein ACFPIJ_58215, partial [Dactylosporangium cerinum]
SPATQPEITQRQHAVARNGSFHEIPGQHVVSPRTQTALAHATPLVPTPIIAAITTLRVIDGQH